MYINDKENVMLITKDKYDKLVELAEAKEKDIKERALKMWEEKGIANLKISMEIRSDHGGEIIDSLSYDFKAQTYIYNNEREFHISQNTKERFSQFVSNWTYELMRHEFGEKLMQFNDFNKEIDKLETTRKRFTIFTIIGWLMAFSMFLTVIITVFNDK